MTGGGGAFLAPKRVLVPFLLACSKDAADGRVGAIASTGASSSSSPCRSNATHIAWSGDVGDDRNRLRGGSEFVSSERRLGTNDDGEDDDCWYQERADAERDALSYLRDNVMPFDVPNMETLGFSDGGPDSDGLDDGLVGPTVTLALDAKVKHPWADDVPRHIYYEYVLNYANVNEPRTNWRPLFTDAIAPILDALPSNASVNDVVKAVNSHLWRALGRNNKSIVFKAGQTPLIFDPMSIIAFGHCSCTGTAILLTNALRAAGIPARVVGTPAWKNARENGNHNWIEVYRNGRGWDFMEPSTPTDPTVEVVEDADDLERDPCRRWFCSAKSEYGVTRVFAARLDREEAETHCPLAWEWDSRDVPGEDRTDYYVEKCGACGADEDVA